jgi:hypothetical protein
MTVHLNVYDLSDNSSLYPLGLGLYHSGVVIASREYTFGAGSPGVFDHNPKDVPNAKFRETISLGQFEGGHQRLDSVLSELRAEFKGSDYSLVFRNCNTFSNTLVWRLIGKEIPGWVNRHVLQSAIILIVHSRFVSSEWRFLVSTANAFCRPL